MLILIVCGIEIIERVNKMDFNFNEDVETNKNCVNNKIKANILSDEEMRKIGFTDYSKENWYFCRGIDFSKNKKYKGADITFSLTIPKNGSDICIDVLDEDWCQPYDYQKMLYNNPKFECALIVWEQVEKWMKYLSDNGIISGHIYGEYI